MKRFWPFCWLIVPMLAGLAAYAAAKALRQPGEHAGKNEPLIEYPTRLDLGVHEIGEVAVGRFTIANRGGGELFVDKVQTSCSCTGMEREQDGHFGHVETLLLKAGEEANLVMRVSVRGVPVGAEMLNVVGFRTNDPTQPNGRIECIVRFVSGGVRAHPESIVFGTVPVGGKLRRVVDVHDDALTPRRIARVTSTNPDRVVARLLAEKMRSAPPDSNPAGVLIGRIEIVVNQESAGEVNEAIQIHLAGESRKPDAITVIGKVAAPIEINPTLLILPRASLSGPIYEGTCVCRSTDEQPLSIRVESTLPGLTVEPLDEGKTTRRIRIRWDPSIGKGSVGGQRRVIRLQAEAGKHQQLLELKLLLKG